MPSGLVVAVEGASAAGKTSAIGRAAASTGWTVVAEAYRRLRPPPSLEFDSPTELAELERVLLEEEARRFTEARSRSQAGEVVLADTGFLGPLTYTWALAADGDVPATVLLPLIALARTLGGRWGLADAYVFVDTPAPIRSNRARADPAGPRAELAVRHARVGDIEREFYRERFAPLLGSRFRWIDGDGPPRLVAERLVAAVRADMETPLSPGPMDAVLALFETPPDGRNRSRGNR